MPATPQLPGSVRSAADLNDEIRALWDRAGGTLTSDQRREYEVLVTAWAIAVRDEQTTTAEAA
ncbi:hypothetical protein PV396_24315 [Streptomyces sp. ME02-8801-2C]|uniref:hypothetical protein n=1 Tax=Streptomyces sp. ME02-8801-2C TaxID=3028680 RepID=UPI0029B7D7F1|nr:hypothetical protein [Streptomyces sp. ME02-8801-2C]MDX3455027.1 hypothetical protein [Streptomyces sp. ME02-8801-2C]